MRKLRPRDLTSLAQSAVLPIGKLGFDLMAGLLRARTHLVTLWVLTGDR